MAASLFQLPFQIAVAVIPTALDYGVRIVWFTATGIYWVAYGRRQETLTEERRMLQLSQMVRSVVQDELEKSKTVYDGMANDDYVLVGTEKDT